MVTRKGLFFGLFLPFSLTNILQAYRITLKNNTSNKAKFKIDYYKAATFSCNSDEREVAAGRRIRIRSRNCPVKRVEATVLESVLNRGEKSVEVKPFEMSVRRSRDVMFVVRGPFEERKNRYVLRRKFNGK